MNALTIPLFLQGSPAFLGQAFAVPQVKLVDEPYSKPALQFFDFYKGSKAVGELIAAFELIELDYSGYLEVTGLQRAAPGCQLSRQSCVGEEPVAPERFPVESHIWLSGKGRENGHGVE